MADCPICKGTLWVCESHPLAPWDSSIPGGCECNCGMPCECNPTGMIGPGVVEIICDVSMPERAETVH